MKKLFAVLAATVVCGACLFTSCKKDEDNTSLNLEEKIIGKWMVAERDGQAALTNEKMLFFLCPPRPRRQLKISVGEPQTPCGSGRESLPATKLKQITKSSK